MPSSLRRHRYWASDCSFALTVPSCQQSCTLRLGVEPSARQTLGTLYSRHERELGHLGGMCCSRVLRRAWRPPAAILPSPSVRTGPTLKTARPDPRSAVRRLRVLGLLARPGLGSMILVLPWLESRNHGN